MCFVNIPKMEHQADKEIHYSNICLGHGLPGNEPDTPGGYQSHPEHQAVAAMFMFMLNLTLTGRGRPPPGSNGLLWISMNV